MTRPAFLLAIFFTALSLSGQTADGGQDGDPEENGTAAEAESEELSIDLNFDKTDWTIGMESFGGDISIRYSYLKSSIPDLIKRELDQADTHILSEPDKARYRNDIISKQKLILLEKLQSSYGTRDSYLFSSSVTSSARKITDGSIDELRKMLEALESVNQESIRTAQMLPVQWASGTEEGGLIEPDQYVPSVICRSKSIDFLIFGEIREIDEYFRMDVSVYDASTDEETLIYSGTAPLDMVDQLAFEAAGELRSIILGRAWSAVRIDTDDPDALIYADGNLIGVGSASVNTLEPGSIFFEAVGVDNSYWSREEVLPALEETVFSAQLSESEKDFLYLTSTPPGANVYIGARWAGTTPLSLPRYRERSLWITLREEGFYEESFEISPESPDSIEILLEEEGLTRLEDFDLKKKDFYRSLGRFSLSVAAPVVTAGVYSNYISRQNVYASKYESSLDSTYYDLAKEMERNYYISYGVFWGTIGISSGLLVDVFVKLSRYIKAAEALAE